MKPAPAMVLGRETSKTMRDKHMRATICAAVVCFGVGYFAEHSISAAGKLHSHAYDHFYGKKSTSLDVVELEITAFNEYTRTHEVYSPHWHYIVEPFRDTTLQVFDSSQSKDGDTQYMWHVSNLEVGEKLNNIELEPGKSVRYVFKDLGRHDIQVTKVEVQSDGGHRPLGMQKIEASCKYVRREIRSLSDHDRNLFLDTVLVMQNVPMADGQQIWGPKFKEKDYFVRLHLLYGADRDCDHWHEGTGFVTSHVALTLEFEQSLQSVHPVVSMPYWDFTLESSFYNQENWRTSQVFHPDWFGDAAPDNLLHTITKGRFAYVPARPTAWNFSDITNSYGVLRAPWNNDPTPFLTRHDHIFGYYNNLKPRGCDGFAKCMEYDTWLGVAKCLNTDAHGHVHELMGGTWNHISNNATLMALGSELMTNKLDFVHLTQALSKELWRNSFLTCPDVCSVDTPSDECACFCKADDVGGMEPYEILHTSGVLSLLAFFDSEEERIISEFSEEANRTEYQLVGTSSSVQLAVWDALLGNLCDPGHIGDMYQASSPNDITFWVLHPTLDRLWHWIRLSADHENFDDTWAYDADVCLGHNPDDLQPWTSQLFGLDGEQMLTNTELYELMNPGADVLPYIYDNYNWPHCKLLGYDMTYRGTADSYSIDGFLS